MAKIRQKISKNAAYLAVQGTAVAAIVAQLLNPLAVSAQVIDKNDGLAKISQNTELTIKETPEGRLFNPPLYSGERPDKVMKAVITAYTSTVDQCDDDPFIAASGKRVYDGMIAANGLPFGTKIKIPSLYGDKVFTVHDRMNARYGYGRMDIWMDTTRAEARKFGVKRVEVEIYYPEKYLAMK